ncbi:site-specific integrase, partial [Klebsiella aerogenes]|uniref:site-specific integrase n=1 Tax=Klebsiella aerogenes TaxID=548 RepID=UPI0013D56E14
MTDPGIDAFIEALWLEDGLSSNTQAAYRRDLSALAAWLAPVALDACTEDQLFGYAVARPAG